MTTLLDKSLRRELSIDGSLYTLTIDPDGFRLVEKGRRSGHALQWEDILSGDAALSRALYASLSTSPVGPMARTSNKNTSTRTKIAVATTSTRRASPIVARGPHRRRK